MIDKSSIIYPNVIVGKNVEIQPYVILGMPTGNDNDKLVIGDNSIIRSHTVIYAGSEIGDNFNCGHGVRIRESVKIGNNSQIGTNSQLEGYTNIGNNAKIHTNVHIGQKTDIGNNVFIAPGVVLTNVLHPLCPEAKKCLKGATIKDGVKIGANCTVNPGITINENVLVGSGSVVARDVEKNVVAIGNPAKAIKSVYNLKCPFEIVEKPYIESIEQD